MKRVRKGMHRAIILARSLPSVYPRNSKTYGEYKLFPFPTQVSFETTFAPINVECCARIIFQMCEETQVGLLA